MIALIVFLLFLWAVCIVIGFAFKTLLWLAVVGIILFLITSAFGALRARTRE
jgi:hypothetical protein